MDYKLDDFLNRRAERLSQFQDHLEEERTDEEPEKIVQVNFSIFNWTSFQKSHPECEISILCNFNEEELDYLVSLINASNQHTRGKRPKINLRDQLMLTLTYFSSYETFSFLSSLFNIKISTYQRIVKRIVNLSFPIFAKKFIPSSFTKSKKEFDNFPDAVGAIDSTTIPFAMPSSKDMQVSSWDGKNHINGQKLQLLVNPDGIAIHINYDFMAGTHDKKICDLSGVTEFLTVKRGKRDLILPIIADRGYQGIEQYMKDAIVMKRGSEEETISRNNDIAHDRVIVENYIGRMKQYWGVLTKGFRGDRTSLSKIIPGLVGLTNYLIDQHPLRDDKKSTAAPPRERIPRFTNCISMTQSTEFVGIKNQGQTCHLNSVLQALYSIKPIVNAIQICSKQNLSPAKEIASIFEVMDSNAGNISYCASTIQLTTYYGAEMLRERDCLDTYNDLLDDIIQNVQSCTQEINSDHFIIKLGTHENLEKWNALLIPFSPSGASKLSENISIFLNRYISFDAPGILPIVLQRPPGSPYEHQFVFPDELVISSHSYKLFGIIAYSSHHFVYFRKKEEKWWYINDSRCYECPPDLIPSLYGGSGDLPLYIITDPYKWVARMLFYTEMSYNIN